MRGRSCVRWAGLCASAVIAADQASKAAVVAKIRTGQEIDVILGVRLVRVSNRGMAFSLGNSRGSGVVVVVLVVVAALVWVVRRELARPPGEPGAATTAQAVAFGVILGGAIGNLVDRFLRHPGWGRGAVVDFVDTRIWPVFNVADAALSLGGIALVVLAFRSSGQSA